MEEHICDNISGAVPVSDNTDEFREFLFQYIRFVRDDQYESEHAFYSIANGFAIMTDNQVLMALELLMDEGEEVRETVLNKFSMAYRDYHETPDYITLLEKDNLEDEIKPGEKEDPKKTSVISLQHKKMIIDIITNSQSEKLQTRLKKFRTSSKCPVELRKQIE